MNNTISLASGMTLSDVLLPGLTIGGILLLVLPSISRENAVARVVVIGLGVWLMWRYLLWRIGETLPPPGYTLEYLLGIVFIVVETLSVVGATLSMSWMTRVRSRTRSQDADEGVRRLRHEKAEPLIDVFICTYNEGKEVLLPTIMGALGIQYSNKRVWVLDDGKRPWLKDFCRMAGSGYITRPNNDHAKAGNINHALEHVAVLRRKPGYIALLDADFVSEPEFLERTLALMHFDDRVAVVQTPQHFVNPDPIQRNLSAEHVWPDEQRYFFDIVLEAKDAWNSAFCCGTSALIRYSALREIGGMPTETVTEDFLLTLCLRERGYRTVYLNERLSAGLAPEGLKEYLTQRGRWCVGLVQICRGSHGPFSIRSDISWIYRLSLVDAFLYWAAMHAFRLLAIVIPSIYLLFDIKPVYAGLYDAIDHTFPYLVVMTLANGWLTQWRVLPIMSEVSQLLAAHTVLRSVAVGLLYPKNQRFKVTLKGGDRSRRFIQWPMMLVFLGYLFVTLSAILTAFLFNTDEALRDSASVALVWCWYNSFVLILACLICIESPRRDTGGRAIGTLAVSHDGHTAFCRAMDVTSGGFEFAGKCPFKNGARVGVGIGSLKVNGQITRVTKDGFAIRASRKTDDLKRFLVQMGSATADAGRLRPMQVAWTVMGRVFR